MSLAALLSVALLALVHPAPAQAATATARPASVQVVALKQVSHRIIKVAASRKGTPYRYGGTGAGGFDCSGFTRWVFKRFGVGLPHSSAAQVGRTTRTRHPRVGDLVFFQHGGHVYHVGIYAGHHQVWHAPYSGTRVRKDHIWTGAVFYGHVKGMRKAITKQARKISSQRARAAATA